MKNVVRDSIIWLLVALGGWGAFVFCMYVTSNQAA